MVDLTVLSFVFGIILFAAVVWWFVPRYQARNLQAKSALSEKDLIELEDEFRKTVTQALAGTILLLTATVAFQQLREAARATDVNDRQQRLAKGFELLGKSTASERTAGVRILGDWIDNPSRYDTSPSEARSSIVIPALSSFVREQTKFTIQHESCEEFEQERPPSEAVSNEVQAALDIIKRWSRKNPLALNMRGLNLSRANLAGANLSGSQFAYADLSDANLSNVDLRNTDFYCANLYHADLSGSDLSGNTVEESGPTTNLAGASMIRVKFCKNGRPSSLAKANLIKANLNESFLDETDLRGARLLEASLFRTAFVRVKLDGQTDFEKAAFEQNPVVETPLAQARNYDEATLSQPVQSNDFALCATQSSVQAPIGKPPTL